MTLTHRQPAFHRRLLAHSVLATSNPSTANTLLQLARRALPSCVARASSMNTYSVLSAVLITLLVLAPQATPSSLAGALVVRTHTLAVAIVHAPSNRLASGRRVGATNLALALAIDASSPSTAGRLAIRPVRARLVLTIGAAPSVVALATTTLWIADSMIVASARAAHDRLARVARIVRIALANAGRHRAAHAAAMTIVRARLVRAIGARSAVGADADTLARIARAVWTAALRLAAARQKSGQRRRSGHRLESPLCRR